MSVLDQVRETIFGPAGLDDATLGRVLARLGSGDADLADIYFERSVVSRWSLEDGRVTRGAFGQAQGVGIRSVHQGDVSFAHSADLRPHALEEIVAAVRAMACHGDGARKPAGIALRPTAGHDALYPAVNPTSDDATTWIAMLETVDAIARALDPRIGRVDANVTMASQAMFVADVEGACAADIRPSVRLSVNVVLDAAGRRAGGMAVLGGRHGREELNDDAIEAMVRRAVRSASANLVARPAPSGPMPVVLAPGYPGVLFHEAVGHGLEADHHRQHVSAFEGRIGERIAAPGVSVVDDGGLPQRSGSLGVDDEGVTPERTVLVDDGILVGLMYDRLNAGLMNARPTGNGRRQSYAHLPMPRMTNTFLLPGDATPGAIISSVKTGLYAVGFGGGSVDITTGRFNFTTTEAYMIENGRVTDPVDRATLIGVGDQALRHIDMIGDDWALDSGEATCGKNGQWMDVSVGQPTIRVNEIMVGGQSA